MDDKEKDKLQEPITEQGKNGDKDLISEGTFKLIAFGCLILILFGIHHFAPQFFHRVVVLSTRGDIKGTARFLSSYGPWAVVVSFLLDVFINAVGFLPSIFLSTANGLIFGLPLGVTISWVAESVGVIISFMVMRYFLRETAEQIIATSNNLKRLDEMSSDSGLVAMTLARTLPYFPSGVLTALGAISKMSFRDYCIATFIGKFPSTALEVILGHDIVNYRANMHRLGMLVTVVIAVYGYMFYRRYKKQKKEQELKEQNK
jgi:uncharacterized membrane protein YdjX (TVP38/TMEM64 family)